MTGTERDIEYLRREFLMKSEYYRKLCYPEKKIEETLCLKFPDYYLEESDWDSSKRGPSRFLLKKYGNAYEQSFDEFLQNKKAFVLSYIERDLSSRFASDQPPIVELNEDRLYEDLGDYSFVLKYPSYSLYLLFQKDFSYDEAKKLGKEFGKLLKKKIYYIKRFYKEELKRYLTVYDNRKRGVSYREICKIVHPELDYTESRRRQLLSDMKKARKIIQDVEKDMHYYW